MIGYVFAGGRSSRMGRDKASLVLGGRTLLDIAMRRLEPLCSCVYLCGGDGIADVLAGEGPLSALAAALAHASSQRSDEIALVTGVDTPFLNHHLLREVIDRASHPGVKAAVPVVDGFAQPLCAAYRASLAAPIRAAFDAGERRMMEAIRTACAPGQLVEFTPSAAAPEDFANLNTPDDFAAAELRWRDRPIS